MSDTVNFTAEDRSDYSIRVIDGTVKMECYLMGKKAMGIKDLEKILVDNPNYPEVEKKLTELKS